MLGAYFYNKTIRKTVSVFGSLFNNIQVRKTSGDRVLSATKVPLAYGPLEKFLARIDELEKLEEQAIAIKLPRMSFEISDISYDSSQKLNKGNKRTCDDEWRRDEKENSSSKRSLHYNNGPEYHVQDTR